MELLVINDISCAHYWQCRALALAPVVDRGLSWFTIKFKFESKGEVNKFHNERILLLPVYTSYRLTSFSSGVRNHCRHVFWTGSPPLLWADIAMGLEC